MKRFTIPCDFGGKKAPFHVYIGAATYSRHPLYYQQLWLRQERGGYIPTEILESFGRLSNIALEHNISFEELCVYALAGAQQDKVNTQGATNPLPTPKLNTTEQSKPSISSLRSIEQSYSTMQLEEILHYAYCGKIGAMKEVARRYQSGEGTEQSAELATLWQTNINAGTNTMKIPCLSDYKGTKQSIEIVYLEQYPNGIHPLFHENERILRQYRARIPADVMNLFEKLAAIARKQKLSFKQLLQQALPPLVATTVPTHPADDSQSAP